MSTTGQLNAKLEELEASKSRFQQIINQAAQNEPRLAILMNQRLELLAEAMLAGNPRPSTSKFDAEIGAVTESIVQDQEAANVAALAIGMIDSRMAAVRADISLGLEHLRQEAVEKIDGEFHELMAKAKTNATALISELSGRFYATAKVLGLVAELELILRRAGAIAWIQREHLYLEQNWKDFWSGLTSIRLPLRVQFSKQQIDIPAWCWEGGSFDVDAFLSPVIQQLRSAGVNVATLQAAN